MFDASAYSVAKLANDDQGRRPLMTTDGLPLTGRASAGTSPLDVALAAHSLCARTFCGCAISSAKAGIVFPILPLSACGWMRRAAERAVRRNCAGTPSTYLAHVLFGNARGSAQREADILALAETMR